MNKPGALFNLKDWLTIPQSAEHFSKIFDEDITQANILRLALDGHLKLSVYFMNDTYAKRGRKLIKPGFIEKNPLPTQIVKSIETILDYPFIDEVELFRIAMKEPDTSDGKAIINSPNIFIDEVREGFKKFKEQLKDDLPDLPQILIPDGKSTGQYFCFFHEEITVLKGVYDLVMFGAGTLDVERKWQQLTDGPEVVAPPLSNGIFVKNSYNKVLPNGVIYQLQKNKEPDNYVPADTLPADSYLVIRTKALIDLQNQIESNQKEDLYPYKKGHDDDVSRNTPPIEVDQKEKEPGGEIKKKIDYSAKTRKDQALLAVAWFNEGKTRREIAKRLFEKEYKNDPSCIDNLLRRIDRLRSRSKK